MVQRYATYVKTINLIFDYLALNISMIIAFYMEGGRHSSWYNDKRYLPIVLVFNLVWLLSANVLGLYRQVLNKDSMKTYRSLIDTYVLFLCLICAVVVLTGTQAYFITREYLFNSALIFCCLLVVFKLIFLIIRKSDRKILYDTRKIVIVGSGRIGNELYEFFKLNLDKGYRLAGFFDDKTSLIPDESLYLGTIDECMAYVLSNNIEEIFCTLPASESKRIESLLVEAEKNLIRFRFVPEYYDYGIKPVTVQTFGHIPVISIRPEPLESIVNRATKRLFDIMFSLMVFVFILSWLFPLLAIIIKLESKGPVFFKQLRSGKDNKPFMCYKFRSMTVNGDSDEKQATRGDERITKTGALLRRTSLDELPQFFNVLRGNMSVIGPRPHMLSHTKIYSELIDSFMVRHFLKPGITGWAQVQGLRGETKTTEAMLKRVEADVWYLENWSFLLDLKIAFLTVWNAIKGDKTAF